MFKAKQSKAKQSIYFLFLLGSLILFQSHLVAQERGNQPERVRELIAEKKSNVPEHMQSRVQYLREFKEYKKVHVVKLPTHLYEEETLVLYIDPTKRELRFHKNRGTEIQIVKREITVFSDSIYIWKGDIYDPTSDEIMGDAMLVQNHKGEITGTIDVAGMFFQIRSLGASGLSAIIEYDEEEVKKQNQIKVDSGAFIYDQVGLEEQSRNSPELKECFNSSYNTTERSLSNDTEYLRLSMTNPTCPKHFARVLVLYTVGAANYGNINNIIAQAITETNDAYWNSNSNTGSVILQHSQQIGFVETGNLNNDLSVLMNSSETNSLRNQHDADIVVILTTPGAYYGISGAAATYKAQNSKAYAVVDVSDATGSRYTFAHEVGHIQGLQHHPSDENTFSDGLYNYGYGHRISYSGCGLFGLGTCKRSTLMAYTPSGYSRIKYFSNPNISYNGEYLGVTGQRENYKVLNNTRVAIANFRDANEVNAAISYVAGIKTQYGQNFTFSDNSCGGNGSYSYEWRKSLNNPSNFGGVVSTSSSYFVLLSPGTWYLQLKVTTSTGQTSTKVISVVAEEDDGSGGGGPGGGPIPKLVNPDSENEHTLPETIQLLPAYPNPFNPSTNISFKLPESGHVHIGVYDLNGREVNVLGDRVFSAGTHQLQLNASELSSGTYIVRLQTGSNVLTQTLTLIK